MSGTDEWERIGDGLIDDTYYAVRHKPCGTEILIAGGVKAICPKCNAEEFEGLKMTAVQGRFEYIGCRKTVAEDCDVCGVKPEYLHRLQSNGGDRGVCRACADEMVIPAHGGLPAIAESWSKNGGGEWVSRWQIEEAYR